MRIFLILLGALCSTKFERSVPECLRVHRMASWWAILPKREIFPRPAMDCSLWKALPSLPFPGRFKRPAIVEPDLKLALFR